MPVKDAYSYPKYCDIAYNWDRKPECNFIEECIKRYSDIKVTSILDIACGTGIHLREFASRGYDVTGLDKSREMVNFVIQKSKSKSLKINCAQSNMKEFKLGRQFECAICLLDSFRYLLRDEDILLHLKSVAYALEPGGLYILDLWMPKGVPPLGGTITEWEDISWAQGHKDIRIDARYCQHAGTFDEKTKTFEDELILNVQSPDFNSAIRSRVKTRALYYGEFKDLVAASGFFDCAGRFYNFDFDLKEGYNIKPMPNEATQGSDPSACRGITGQDTTFGIRTNIILKRKKEGRQDAKPHI